MQQDSINFGGGYSNSDSFQEEDSMGEIATGYSSSTNFILHAGYQQMKTAFIALSAPSSTTLEPSIPGLTGGNATGTSYAHVMTTNEFGYTLQINASTSPALQHINTTTYYFDDYIPVGSAPDFVWDIAPTTSVFGFTPEGIDIVSKYRDNSGVCNVVDGNDTERACWGPLSQTLETIASSENYNDPEGTTTTIHFQAESGNQHLQVSGKYRAQITITAYMN
ncbi:MAG TPA: hypothetical protein P5230_03465 [Candidatus Magasanikbacteria bacterium]|nr:hypothetical protein [Candidatus Magasanikbacteria bacterium]